MIEASGSPGWIQEIRRIKESNDPHSEADEYGVNSFVYRARLPFHPARIAQWIDSILYFANEWAKLPEDKRQVMKNDPKYNKMQSVSLISLCVYC